MIGTFKDEASNWYMNLPKASILGYLDLIWKMSQSFPIQGKAEMPINVPLNDRSGLAGHAREYQTLFSERTTRTFRTPHEKSQTGGLKGSSFKVQNTITKDSVNIFCYNILEGESNEKRYHPHIPRSSSKLEGDASKKGKQPVTQIQDTRKQIRPSCAKGKQLSTPSTQEGQTSYER